MLVEDAWGWAPQNLVAGTPRPREALRRLGEHAGGWARGAQRRGGWPGLRVYRHSRYTLEGLQSQNPQDTG